METKPAVEIAAEKKTSDSKVLVRAMKSMRTLLTAVPARRHPAEAKSMKWEKGSTLRESLNGHTA